MQLELISVRHVLHCLDFPEQAILFVFAVLGHQDREHQVVCAIVLT